MQDWQAQKTAEDQGADVRELHLKGKLHKLSFKIRPHSAFWRAGFKLVDPNGVILPLRTQGSLVFHLGSTGSSGHYGLTAYHNGEWVEELNKTKSYGNKPITVELTVNDKNFLEVYVDGSLEFKPSWHLENPSIREKVALVAWGDEHEYKVDFKDIDVLDENGKRKIFYSWQIDTGNRNYIQRCIEEAVKQVHGWEIETATRNTKGSPDIGATILSKIDESDLFLADVSIINPKSRKIRKCPNPNVIYELGYAVKRLGEDNTLLVANKETTKETAILPFDIRNRRLTAFEDFSDPNAKKKIISALSAALTGYEPPVEVPPTSPYIFCETGGWSHASDGTMMTFDLHNEENQHYLLEEINFNGGVARIDRDLKPQDITRVSATNLNIPPLDQPIDTMNFTVSRLGKRYRITQPLKLSKRADEKFNLDSITASPSIEEI